MKVFLNSKDENGTEHIIGFRSKDVIINERGDIKIPISYEKLDMLEKDIKELKEKTKPVRGLRAKRGNIIDEACDMSKEDIQEVLHKFDKSNENNMYLNQKERNVIRTQIEGILSKFEIYVDDHLCKNELELAKADHNVVLVSRSILVKLDIADCNEEIN